MIAPIGPVRVAAVRPAQPGPMDDPSEDGLGVEAVLEPTFAPIVDQVTIAPDAGDAQLDLAHRSYQANAAATVTAIDAGDPARAANQESRGNAAVTTAFDRRPSTSIADAPRGDFASPFARALSAYALR